MNKSTARLKQNLYPKEAIMKAAYHYLDKAYLHVDVQGEDYVVSIVSKNGDDAEIIRMGFENEALAQTVRYQVFLQTHTLREVLMARAMASTIVGEGTAVVENDEIPESDDDLKEVLRDWFERNNE